MVKPHGKFGNSLILEKQKSFPFGHTGFKGSWMSRVLLNYGANVTGYSFPAPTEPNLFSLAGLEGNMTSTTGDIRDFDCLKSAFSSFTDTI